MSFTWSVPSVEEVSPDVRTHELTIYLCIRDERGKVEIDFPILLFYHKGWNDECTKRVWKRENPISNLKEIKACLESETHIENSIIFNIEVSASEVYKDAIFNDTKSLFCFFQLSEGASFSGKNLAYSSGSGFLLSRETRMREPTDTNRAG